jgi:hypothetical protein
MQNNTCITFTFAIEQNKNNIMIRFYLIGCPVVLLSMIVSCNSGKGTDMDKINSIKLNHYETYY